MSPKRKRVNHLRRWAMENRFALSGLRARFAMEHLRSPGGKVTIKTCQACRINSIFISSACGRVGGSSGRGGFGCLLVVAVRIQAIRQRYTLREPARNSRIRACNSHLNQRKIWKKWSWILVSRIGRSYRKEVCSENASDAVILNFLLIAASNAESAKNFEVV